MDKLELKHIAPYLPYRVNVLHSEKNIALCISGAFFKRNLDDYFTYKLLNWDNEVISSDCKLLLRPLSDLTKEIEVNGEKFVPIEVLGKMYEPNGSFEEGLYGWNIATGGDDYQDYYLDIELLNDGIIYCEVWAGEPHSNHSYSTEQFELPYTMLHKLFEWHFDVFGLIKSGLAIDVNTLGS